jgi:hypothetical protein
VPRRPILDFPNPVDEHAARLVAGGVVVMSVTVAAFGWMIVLVPLALGFVARVLSGPRFSPLGLLVTRVIVPRSGWTPKHVPGPPKRFAQGIGVVVSLSALALWSAGMPGAARVLAGVLVVAAGLESVVGFCLGCTIFGWLMRRGVIPDTVCEACNDLSARLAVGQPTT